MPLRNDDLRGIIRGTSALHAAAGELRRDLDARPDLTLVPPRIRREPDLLEDAAAHLEYAEAILGDLYAAREKAALHSAT